MVILAPTALFTTPTALAEPVLVKVTASDAPGTCTGDQLFASDHKFVTPERPVQSMAFVVKVGKIKRAVPTISRCHARAMLSSITRRRDKVGPGLFFFMVIKFELSLLRIGLKLKATL